jgi:hypothetical protein
MSRIDIDGAIRMHNQWRRQFLNAFAGGDYADMPLSEHRSCTLALELRAALGDGSQSAALLQFLVAHELFHGLADEIIDLSNNGLGDEADLLLPELNEAAHRLVSGLDRLREPAGG